MWVNSETSILTLATRSEKLFDANFILKNPKQTKTIKPTKQQKTTIKPTKQNPRTISNSASSLFINTGNQAEDMFSFLINFCLINPKNSISGRFMKK